MANLEVDFAGIPLKNLLTAASGTFGFGLEYHKVQAIDVFGAIITKGLTLEPRPGNQGVRICETPSGLLNSIGLANPGLEVFRRDILPELKKTGATVIVNIAGKKPEEYMELSEALSRVNGVSGIELNISCPNVEKGMEFGVDADLTYYLVKSVRETTELPLIVKLTPNAPDINAVALATQEAGADGLSLINTVKGMAIDIHRKKPVFNNKVAGLSGPAIKPIALKEVYNVSRSVSLPVMGVGGITDYRDVIEFILAGASAVSLGSINFVNPQAVQQISQDLNLYMKREGYSNIFQMQGLAW